ncbi:PEPxxWA-CTERM sorting domain-containing protein [Polymorphobacter megasporae]|uniref:PEPxxWA-CTERM sorting domain-containing protein n=1 Tax=Glacieibacterium megasporae TaxID=2835787 RepID=UPI001C1DD341|nr:PEPxxWA-CTERM sorting domain-containing protein [Polymorphobacter megasporae]UAJ10084.1 PEPxxWA-CTERM sorting domain-containing protein [Polymorphobacter megasporae]
MNRIVKATFAALTCFGAVVAAPASADTIANPANSYGSPYLSGSLTGGNQTQYFGETFTAPISGNLTDFQFTLNTSTLQSVYGIVFAWDGTGPTTELYRSAVRSGAAGLFDFAPTGVLLTQGKTYVAFLSTFGLTGNSGLATVGSCLPFVGCASNSIPNLGTLVIGNVLGDGPVFNSLSYLDATFSATITAAAVPEPATWVLMIVGMGAVGYALRRRQRLETPQRQPANG